MPRQEYKKLGLYKIYPTGYVYYGSVLKFYISPDDRAFGYLWDRGWKKDKKDPDELVNGYPESLSFLEEETLGSGEKEKIDLAPLIEKSLKRPHKLDGKLACIMREETKDKMFRDATFAEALYLILDKLDSHWTT